MSLLVRVYILRTTTDPFVDLDVPHILITCGGHLANWSRRARIINYCVDVLDTSYEEKKLLADEAKGADLRAQRKAQAELYSADIKVNVRYLCLSDLTYSHPLCLMFSAGSFTTNTPSKRSFGRDQQMV